MICIAGKNDIAVFALETLLNTYMPNDLCVCVNKTDHGINGWQKSLKFYANKYDVRQYSLEQLYDIPELLFISLEYDRLISPDKFTSPAMYNIHFSLLPQYRGMYTSAWPILNNEHESGVTLHKIDYGIDTGNIIAQIKFPIEFSDTGRDLYIKYIKYGKELFHQQIQNLIDNHPEGTEQDKYCATYYSKDSINYKNLQIDLNQPAIAIYNQIRAFNFKEYQQPQVFGTRISEAQITEIRSAKKSGIMLSETQDEYIVSSLDYDVILKKCCPS